MKNNNQSKKPKRDSRLADVCKRFVRNKAAVIGLVILIAIILTIIFADYIADPELITKYNVKEKLQPPSAVHPFGTDNLGRDMFVRVIHGTRITVGIGVGATLISLFIGAAIATVCALNRRVDFVVMRITDVFYCIPSLLLAIVLLAILGGSVFSMMVTLTLIQTPSFIILIRSVLLGVVEQDYVKAARISGTTGVKLVLLHILPNALDPIIVNATMTISSMLLSAAALSFIGIGISPPSPEWGAMLNFSQQFFKTAPHMAIFPGAAIALTALSINLVGDGLRDALDPKATK
ncbi:MAG: ABC transporter permease [Oscillospiraceae bacterium]|nr:ABC transporter permease [Oscillospiraceae bacterium]